MMDKELIDQLWNRALHESIANGEQFTRYRFAQLVAEHEREATEKSVGIAMLGADFELYKHVMKAIRARGEA